MTTVKRRLPAHLWRPIPSNSSRSQNAARPSHGIDEIERCMQAFMQATNWGVQDRTTQGSVEDAMGAAGSNGAMSANRRDAARSGEARRWTLVDNLVSAHDADDAWLDAMPSVPMEKADRLLASMESLVERLRIAEATIRRQEAELATALVITSDPSHQRETANRLEAILESTSIALGAKAAAVYLLNDTTTELKMRSCFGLPIGRLTQPPRPLRGAYADLEALLGNAVLMSDIAQMHDWSSPEDFAAALVVPIGTATMPHGTVWFWCSEKRSFSRSEVEVANLAAGRIMGEIERSILGREVLSSRLVQRQIEAAGAKQESMQPDMQILHEDYDLGGWTSQCGPLGGAVRHWNIAPGGLMTLAVGATETPGAEGALVASAALALIRSMWSRDAAPKQILRSVNETLWSSGDADWRMGLALAQFNPTTGYGSICSAGNVEAFIVAPAGVRALVVEQSPAGSSPDAVFTPTRFILQPGEILVALTPTWDSGPGAKPEAFLQFRSEHPSAQRKGEDAAMEAIAPQPLTLDAPSHVDRLLSLVREWSDESASDIANVLARLLPPNDLESGRPHDRALIVVKNIRKPIR